MDNQSSSRESDGTSKPAMEVLSQPFATFDHQAQVVSPFEDETRRDAEAVQSAHTARPSPRPSPPFPLFPLPRG